MVTEAADQGRWCALDLIRAASIFTRSTHLCVLWALRELTSVSAACAGVPVIAPHAGVTSKWQRRAYCFMAAPGLTAPLF